MCACLGCSKREGLSPADPEWQSPGGAGKGGELWRHSRAGPTGVPQSREGPGPTWSGNRSLSSVLPVPVSRAPGGSLFPPGEGRGHGRASEMGFPVPRRLALLQHSGHPPFLLGAVSMARAPRGTASRGDSASTHARHVLGPGRRPGEPGSGAGGHHSGPQAPAFRAAQPLPLASPELAEAWAPEGRGGERPAGGPWAPGGHSAGPCRGVRGSQWVSERTERRVPPLVCVAAHDVMSTTAQRLVF